ncbi:hypothetical protein AMTR_s00064p00174720 [Amborella trichopoda]|uniref:Uncharacterized protein n=1 Tax=Amborella trichopoda TaxID=13333 RepID=U5DH87_AMBTC|nr:hypothetical protein AMTR_s00064p00174720 [Amborella trichopoda]
MVAWLEDGRFREAATSKIRLYKPTTDQEDTRCQEDARGSSTLGATARSQVTYCMTVSKKATSSRKGSREKSEDTYFLVLESVWRSWPPFARLRRGFLKHGQPRPCNIRTYVDCAQIHAELLHQFP